MKLKKEIDEDSESDPDESRNVSNQLNISESEEFDLPNIKTVIKKPTNNTSKPSFKLIGQKIMFGKRSLKQFDELTKSVIQTLEKNLMTEYFELNEKVYEKRFSRMFSKYVNFLMFIEV